MTASAIGLRVLVGAGIAAFLALAVLASVEVGSGPPPHAIVYYNTETGLIVSPPCIATGSMQEPSTSRVSRATYGEVVAAGRDYDPVCRNARGFEGSRVSLLRHWTIGPGANRWAENGGWRW